MVQPQPAQPVMILPWLQHPLTPLLWAALGISAVIFIVPTIRSPRSPERFPVSPRWLAVVSILCCSLFAALSYGADLSHPAALYASPLLILISTALARSAWHGSDERQHTRTLAAAIAAASLFVSGSLLLFDLAGASTRSHPHGRWDVGLGWGEAVSHLLPAIGSSLIPLALIPATHPRATAVRRSVVCFAAALTIITAATVAAGALAMTAPMPPAPAVVALADRYIYLNAVLPVPVLLATACAIALVFAASSSSWWVRAVIVLIAACAAFPIVSFLGTSYGQRTAFEFDYIGPPVCLAAGFVLGLLLAPINRFNLVIRGGLLVALAAFVFAAAEVLPNPSGSFFASWQNRSVALMGLLAAALLPASRSAIPQTPLRDPLAAVLIALSLLAGSLIAGTLELRSQLTHQAARFSKAFKYESLPSTTPELRRELEGIQQALHMSRDGFRWAWVTPRAIWWTRDDAWRDAIIIADHDQPRVTDPEATGAYYGAKITEPDRKRLSDVSFTDAKYIAVIQPSPAGQKKLIVHGIAVRQGSPNELLSFARLEPSNLRTWLGIALGIPLAFVLARRQTAASTAFGVCAATLLILTAFLGLGGSIGLLVSSGVTLTLVSLRRDDRWHTPSMLAILMGSALALGGLLLRLNDLV